MLNNSAKATGASQTPLCTQAADLGAADVMAVVKLRALRVEQHLLGRSERHCSAKWKQLVTSPKRYQRDFSALLEVQGPDLLAAVEEVRARARRVSSVCVLAQAQEGGHLDAQEVAHPGRQDSKGDGVACTCET
jgi:hypothetical protein